MSINKNIIPFPDKIQFKKAKYERIRDEIESLLFNYASSQEDLWAVSLAAGRFSAMNFKADRRKGKIIRIFETCIETQKDF